MVTPGSALKVLRAEGFLGTRDRALDRLAEVRRRRSFRLDRAVSAAYRTATLELIATRPAPRLGGVQIRLLRRLEAEARLRPTALIYPEPGGYRLELAAPSGRRALAFAARPLAPPPAVADAGF
ncbi:MAG TPA: hypothetical protein VGC93_08185, partial [Thermoanaerobaculia bacterium]